MVHLHRHDYLMACIGFGELWIFKLSKYANPQACGLAQTGKNMQHYGAAEVLTLK